MDETDAVEECCRSADVALRDARAALHAHLPPRNMTFNQELVQAAIFVDLLRNYNQARHVSDKLKFVETPFTSRLFRYSFAWLHSRVYTVHMSEIAQDTCRMIHIFHTMLTLFYFLSGWSRFMNHQTNISNLKKIPAHRPSIKVTGRFVKK